MSGLAGAPAATPASAELRAAVDELNGHVTKSPLNNLAVATNLGLVRTTLLGEAPLEKLEHIRSLALSDPDPALQRAVGSMIGMAIADSIGHNFEFMSVQDSTSLEAATDKRRPFFEYPATNHPGGRCHNAWNKFHLKPGQWTDDCSMGLCIADSLLTCNGYDGSNQRVWYWNWWKNGLNNAFRLDKERANGPRGATSVGLGGNISMSVMDVQQQGGQGDTAAVQARFNSQSEDAGNGSLMRLAPLPLWFRGDIEVARVMAAESSLTTHPGPLAAEACSFMAHVIVRALNRPAGAAESIQDFLDEMRREYLEEILPSQYETPARGTLKRLLEANEPEESTERCWNWRGAVVGCERTIANRGHIYNGYPVSPGYFGAFSLDGLAMALHALYHTNSFNEAVAYVVNFAGDSDTVGSICAQMAGAFYGSADIDPVWIANLRQWDEGHTEIRAIALMVNGSADLAGGGAEMPTAEAGNEAGGDAAAAALRPGKRVVLQELARAELNGTQGIITSASGDYRENVRFNVTLADGRTCRVRPVNLALV